MLNHSVGHPSQPVSINFDRSPNMLPKIRLFSQPISDSTSSSQRESHMVQGPVPTTLHKSRGMDQGYRRGHFFMVYFLKPFEDTNQLV